MLYCWDLVAALSLFFTKIWVEIVIGFQFFGHAGDTKKSTSDGNMHHKDEDDGVWSDGEQDGEQRVVVSGLQSL